jgi:hypothetical protein
LKCSSSGDSGIRGARDGGIRARPRRIFAIPATDVQVGEGTPYQSRPAALLKVA